MINRCPHCGFEPIKDQLVCPNCGKEIKENIAEKLRIDNKEVIHLEENAIEKNDNIVWSDLQEVPIGTLMEHMSGEKDQHATEKNDQTADDIENKEESTVDVNDQSAQETTEKIVSKENNDEMKIDNQEAETSLDDTENELDEEPNPILAQYLEMHNARKLAQQQAEAVENNVVQEIAEEKVVKDSQPESVMSEEVNEAPIADEASAKPNKAMQFDPDYLIDDSDDENQTSQPSNETIGATLSQISKLNQEETGPSTNDEQLEATSSSDDTTKFKKWRSVALAAALLLAVGTGYWYAHHQRNASDEKVLEQVDQQVEKLSTKIDQLYTTKQRDFIKSTITLAQINQLNKQLANFDGQENYQKLKKRLETAKDQLLSEQDINDYFTKAILANGKLNHDAHIDYSKKFDLQLRKGKTAFDQLANLAIKQGQDEYKAYEDAKKAVDDLMSGYKNQLLASSVTREKYQQAKKLVDQLFDSSQKTTMAKQLQTIDQALTKQEQEQKQKQEQQNQSSATTQDSNDSTTSSTTNGSTANTNQSGQATTSVGAENAYNTQPVYASWISEDTQVLTPQTAHQVNNQPLIASRLSDLQDVNNPAWSWAPGVKEKVLQACIDRGYVVPGGYVLERVRIENGEGYYNLYSISPSAKFSASPDKPMYVVTINCKTGFYKGNGNDHTIR
ncbi:MAG TPA: cell division site-positioning protein MapZ family protein [Enterococcus columbae]|nr:cell division site-positioning protein MapZ family protein [Enterococcus columbae]